MKNKLYYLMLLVLAAITASCGGNEFKIDMDIANVGGQGVKVIFRGDSGVVDDWATTEKKGRFSYKGSTGNPVIVGLFGRNNTPLAYVVADKGDHIKVKGDAASPATIRVKGSRVNEDWQLFRDEHADFYKDVNLSRLDAAIEKYVREHPTDMLSTVLLVADYSDYTDRDKVKKLLQSIDTKARPASLTESLATISNYKRVPLPRLMTLKLVKHGGDFQDITLTGGVSLISLWASPQQERNALIQKLAGLDAGISVIDVLAESDTLQWHKTIAEDPDAWKHYWAPGGPLEPGIQLLGITSIPWYAVTDSTGMVTYSGPDINAAIRATKR